MEMINSEVYRLPEYAIEAVNMTSFHGSIIYTTVEKLVSLFGEPIHETDNKSKVQYEWYLTVDDTPFKLYDWKEYRHYRKDEIIGFHIGAHSKFESIRAEKAMKRKIEKSND